MSDSIRKRLFSMEDLGYKSFQGGLMPTVDSQSIIGVRTPLLKKYAKEIYGTIEAESFLKKLPHTYYEENNLHAFLINGIKNFDLCIGEVEMFLPYVDNWATCDGLRPVCFKNNGERLLPYIEKWLGSEHNFTVRFGIEMLMVHYLDGGFRAEYARKVSRIKTDDYYVKMMTAWYFATALAKQWDACIWVLEDRVLDGFTHNKTVQKCMESFRIQKEKKEYLKTLKI